VRASLPAPALWVIGACGKLQLHHGCLHQGLAGLVQGAELPHLGRAHVGVTSDAVISSEPFPLPRAGRFHAGPHHLVRFPVARIGELFILHSRHFHVDVDTPKNGVLSDSAVAPRSASGTCPESLTGLRYHHVGAGARPHRVAIISTRAGVHRRHQFEIGWEGQRALRPPAPRSGG
jgi:hypothetical protein